MDDNDLGYGEAATVGRPAELFRDPHQRSLVIPELLHLLSDVEIERAAEIDQAPVPDAAAREGYYGPRHLAYWLSGADDYQKIVRHARCSPGERILDFGGASGRVARHFATRLPECEVVIADLNPSHVNFVNKVFPTNMKAVKTASRPPIPVADRSFKLIYAASVFTHIDVFETSWLAELERLLTNEGVAWLTFHSEHTWSNMDGSPLRAKLDEDPAFSALHAANPVMPSERLVFYYGANQNYSCNVFHSSDYIRRVWGRFFDVITIIPAEHAYHSVAVLKKKDRGRA